MEASWKIGGLFKADACEVAKEIYSMGDSVKPADLVEFARNPESELHKCFEWDDSVAGEKYRELQASKVLRLLVVTKKPVEQEAPKQYRLFVNTGDNSGDYKPLTLVMRNQTEYESLLETARQELQAFKKKYSMLTELAEIFKEIDLL